MRPGMLLALAAAMAANAKIIQVQVGGEELLYEPSNVIADVHDIIQFNFNVDASSSLTRANHTVTQVSYAAPCTALPGGFSSPLIANLASISIEVLSLTPIWFACAFTSADLLENHCQQGMVGSINAEASGNETWGAFASHARDTAPGGFDNVTLEGTGTGSGVGATVINFEFPQANNPPASSSVTDSSSALESATSTPTPANKSPALSPGGIAAVCIGGIALVVGALVLVRWVAVVRRRRKRQSSEWMRRLEMTLRKRDNSEGGAKNEEAPSDGKDGVV